MSDYTPEDSDVRDLVISGHPLEEPVVLHNAIYEAVLGWKISYLESKKLLNAWVDAPAADGTARQAHWSENAGGWVTALYDGGELTISEWESDSPDGLIFLDGMPFDFEVTPERVDHRRAVEALKKIDTFTHTGEALEGTREAVALLRELVNEGALR
jgi:hypothetical protein